MQSNHNPIFIMGIDPGLANTGWGIIEVQGSKKKCIAYGCITTSSTDPIDKRLKQIYDGLVAVISRYHPTELGIESIFFSANVKSAIATGQARGAALVAVATEGLEVGEYTPLQIKQTIVGTGAADKDQVTYMVRAILGLDHNPKPDHAADALGAAICHSNFRNSISKKYEEQIAKEAETIEKKGDKIAAIGSTSSSMSVEEFGNVSSKTKRGKVSKADLDKLGISSSALLNSGKRISGWE
jgi:crossover junction endodeoxyribonuclease RuvC